MNSIKQMIRTGAATLCAVCLLSACSSTLDEALDGSNTAQALTNIQIGDFPAFGSEANNGTQTRSANIGTYDEGKAEWINGDEILLKITDSKSVVTTATLVYDGSKWAPSETLEPRFGSATIEAYYAPAYEWTNNELALKAGKSAGTEEYLTFTSPVQQLTDGFTITFGSRNYSRLRVATDPGMKVTLTTASFTANGETTKAESGISATADDKGNAYFYGTWTADASAKLETDAVRTYGTIENKTITLPTAETAKSYAVAGPKWVINHSCYYYWDASLSIVEEESDNNKLSASNSCKDCPTARQLVKYINAGYYYDDGTIEIDGWQTYTILKGYDHTPTNYHNGLWLPKYSTIDGFNDEKGDQAIWINSIADEHKITAANAAKIRTSGNYFFLPATGVAQHSQDGIIVGNGGTDGQYWSKTSGEVSGYHVASCLSFNSNMVFVAEKYLLGTQARVPMVIE